MEIHRATSTDSKSPMLGANLHQIFHEVTTWKQREKKHTCVFFGVPRIISLKLRNKNTASNWGLTGNLPPKDAALHDLDTWLERAQNEEADSAGDRPGNGWITGDGWVTRSGFLGMTGQVGVGFGLPGGDS